ncbi:MAG: leucine-rich repeat protein, partial [Clostridia bacterium]|nr:leucine-rich repeat protein [Clostridia bacterium]
DLDLLGDDWDYGVFENCTSLKKVVLPNSKGYAIGVACFRNTAIEKIEIPNGVTQIYKNAFENTPLKGINLPESCTKVGEYAFANTKLNENGLKTPDGKAYGIAFVCKTVEINKEAFNLTDGEGKPTGEQLKTTIAGYDNSNAHSYAIENDMKFVSLGDWDPCKITYHGDIDGDGQTIEQDVARLTQYVNGWKDIQINVDACDVNGDGDVNLLDVARLKQYVNGWDVPIY